MHCLPEQAIAQDLAVLAEHAYFEAYKEQSFPTPRTSVNDGWWQDPVVAESETGQGTTARLICAADESSGTKGTKKPLNGWTIPVAWHVLADMF
jgi:hypothetical protein